MRDKKLRQLNMLVIIATFCCLIFIGLFVFVFAPDGQKKLKAGKLTEFNDGWLLRDYRGQPDQFVDLPEKIKGDAEEVIVIVNEVPEDVGPDSVMIVRTNFQNIMVTINNEKIYTNGVMTDQKLMKNAVPCYNMIELKSAQPGDLITIYLVSSYKKYSGDLQGIYYGDKGDVVSDIISKNCIGFIFSILLIVVTLLLAISLIFMKNIRVNKVRAAYGFGFINAVALWSITANPIMQLITSNTFGVYMANMTILLILPILYIMHQRCFAIKRRYGRIFEIGIYIFAVNMLTGVVFQMLHICDFATYIIVTKVFIVLGLILLSGIMYLAADTYGDKTIYSNLVANAVLTVAALLESLLSIFSFYREYDGVVLQAGVGIFMVLLVVSVEKGIIKDMNHTRSLAEENVESETNKALKKINTNLVYSTLGIVVNDLKTRDMENSRLIYDTSVYLKYNIMSTVEKNMVPFSQEMEYIKAYLGMQKKRNVALEIEVEDKIVDFYVPFNTIEPLVENAVVNGALCADAGGRLVVRSYERLDCFAIQIVDNGKGIGPDKRFEGKQSYKSIKKKLKSMCNAAIEIKNKPGKGTIITVKVPKEGYVVKEN